MRRLLLLFATLSVSGCLCSGPPKGECTGTWGGVTYDKVQIDLESKLVMEASGSCLVPDLHRYELSWKQKELALTFATRGGGPSSLSPRDIAVPVADGTLESFSLRPDVAGATGNIHLVIVGIQGRRAGSLNLTAGSEKLDCEFEVPYEKQGTNPYCGGSGDGD